MDVIDQPVLIEGVQIAIDIHDRGAAGGKTFLPVDVRMNVDGTQATLVLPKSVADHYRQQGRRQLQSELRDLLNAERR